MGAIAVGFLAGLVIPSTQMEDEKIGPMADQVKSTAAATGQQALEHGKQVAQDAAQSAVQTAQASGNAHGQELAESAQASARSTVSST